MIACYSYENGRCIKSSICDTFIPQTIKVLFCTIKCHRAKGNSQNNDMKHIFVFLIATIIGAVVIGLILHKYTGGDNDDYYPW